MRMGRDRQAGGSKFEFALVVALIGVLAALLMGRLQVVIEETERLEVDLTIRHIRTGLQLAVAERTMTGRDNTLVDLLDADPLSLLGHRPRGYFGDADKVSETGTWSYDRRTRTLLYRPRQPSAFGDREELRWRLRAFAGHGGHIVGLRLEAQGNGLPPG